ncbi:hypothetical protein FHS40_009264 [Streptomyces spectabilis]|uniref:MarR family transcriptional regulator n=1 Tax=Streptomyces spectabilis TaxID=68270 RepID=A0A7W8B4C9_STRST|nr:hypothetical protein [Streptomyces spectabilis]
MWPLIPSHPTGEVLCDLATRRATGAVRSPTGCFYLYQGEVYCAESPASTGLEQLLTASGRVSPARWKEAVQAAGPSFQVGHHLLECGWLTQGELELSQSCTVIDAALFALPFPPDAAEFTPGVTHWLGVIRPIPVAAIIRAVQHCAAKLSQFHAWASADRTPVIAAYPPPYMVTYRQRELLAHADGRHTPPELAQMLGRSAFETILATRRLAARGLVQLPNEPPTAYSSLPGLPRRLPGSTLAEQSQPGVSDVTTWQPSIPAAQSCSNPDVALLVRLRTALEEHL